MEDQSFEFAVEDESGQSKAVTVQIKQAVDISIDNLRNWCEVDAEHVLLVWSDDKSEYQLIENEEHLCTYPFRLVSVFI